MQVLFGHFSRFFRQVGFHLYISKAAISLLAISKLDYFQLKEYSALHSTTYSRYCAQAREHANPWRL